MTAVLDGDGVFNCRFRFRPQCVGAGGHEFYGSCRIAAHAADNRIAEAEVIVDQRGIGESVNVQQGIVGVRYDFLFRQQDRYIFHAIYLCRDAMAGAEKIGCSVFGYFYNVATDFPGFQLCGVDDGLIGTIGAEPRVADFQVADKRRLFGYRFRQSKHHYRSVIGERLDSMDKFAGYFRAAGDGQCKNGDTQGQQTPSRKRPADRFYGVHTFGLAAEG